MSNSTFAAPLPVQEVEAFASKALSRSVFDILSTVGRTAAEETLLPSTTEPAETRMVAVTL